MSWWCVVTFVHHTYNCDSVGGEKGWLFYFFRCFVSCVLLAANSSAMDLFSGCSMLLSPFKDCNDVRDNNFATSGVYRVNPLGSSEDFSVYCDLTTDGGGWLVSEPTFTCRWH